MDDGKLILFSVENFDEVSREIFNEYAKDHDLKAALEKFQKSHSIYDDGEWIDGITIQEAGNDRYIILCTDDEEVPAIRAVLVDGDLKLKLLGSGEMMQEAYNVLVHQAAKAGKHIDIYRF